MCVVPVFGHHYDKQLQCSVFLPAVSTPSPSHPFPSPPAPPSTCPTILTYNMPECGGVAHSMDSTHHSRLLISSALDYWSRHVCTYQQVHDPLIHDTSSQIGAVCVCVWSCFSPHHRGEDGHGVWTMLCEISFAVQIFQETMLVARAHLLNCFLITSSRCFKTTTMLWVNYFWFSSVGCVELVLSWLQGLSVWMWVSLEQTVERIGGSKRWRSDLRNQTSNKTVASLPHTHSKRDSSVAFVSCSWSWSIIQLFNYTKPLYEQSLLLLLS